MTLYITDLLFEVSITEEKNNGIYFLNYRINWRNILSMEEDYWIRR